MTIREAWKAEVEIRVYQLIGILLILTVTWAGGIYGLWRTYEHSERVDVDLCQQRVEEHNSLRGVLIALLGDDAVEVVDAGYPQLDVADCDDLGRR